MSERVYCKNCKHFDGWMACNVPVSNENSVGFAHWYSANKNDHIIRYCCNSQNKNNDCDQYIKK